MKKKIYTSPWLLLEQVTKADVMTASSEGSDNAEIPLDQLLNP